MSTIPVYEGGALRAGVQSARQALRSSEATLERARQALQYVLASGMLDVAEAHGSVDLAEAVLTAEQALRARVAAYVDAGSRTRADLLQQDAAIAKAEHGLANARSQVARAELALVQVLRLDPAEAWTFVPPDAVPGSTSTSAEAARADVQAAEAAVQAASADVRAAQATALPSVGVALGASTSWLSTESASVPSQLRDQAQTWATVELDVPIFDRGLARNAVANAHISERAARLDLALRQEAAATDHAAARISDEAARAAVAAAARHRDAAVAASAVIEQRYEAGAASLSELSAAHAEAAAAEQDVLTASIAVRRTAFEWAWAIGE
jgi:outer membrane protein